MYKSAQISVLKQDQKGFSILKYYVQNPEKSSHVLKCLVLFWGLFFFLNLTPSSLFCHLLKVKKTAIITSSTITTSCTQTPQEHVEVLIRLSVNDMRGGVATFPPCTVSQNSLQLMSESVSKKGRTVGALHRVRFEVKKKIK